MSLRTAPLPALALPLALTMLAGCGTARLVEEAPVDVSPITVESALTGTPPPLPPRRAGSVAVPRAGVVTAGDIDDTLNLAAFSRYADRTAKEHGLTRVSLARPILARLIGPDGAPAPGTRVTLRRPGAEEPFYDGYSDVDGQVTVLPGALEVRVGAQVELRAFAGDHTHTARISTKGARQDVALPFASAWAPDFLDLVFVVDSTGSMQDELDWLAKELRGLVRAAKRQAPGVDIRFGLVAYKAPGDPVPLRRRGFTHSAGEMRRWIAAETADGGAGGPEIVARALEAAVDMPWRRGKGERIIFQIGDEPPQDSRHLAHLDAAGRAAAQGIHIYGLGASGVEAKLELLMRQAAVMTGGRYLFLTDDSGVGLAHGEPAVSCYRVTALSGLVRRILASELSGRRIEAPSGEVIREVGSYRRGVCRTQAPAPQWLAAAPSICYAPPRHQRRGSP